MNAVHRYLRWAGIAAIFVVMSVFAYGLGVFSAVFEVFPYPKLLKPPFKALSARQRRADRLDDVYETSLWQEARFEATGVVEHDPSRSFPGYTFFTRTDDSAALLIDMAGNVVHKWRLPFRRAWQSPPHTDHPSPESHIYWRRARMFPNGDVLAMYSTVADTPYGYGLVKVDKDSNLIWKYAGNTHHDFAVANDGSIYAVVQQLRETATRPVTGMPHLPPVVLEDVLVRLDADGREQRRLNLLDLISNSPYRHLLQMYAPGSTNPATDGEPFDVLHTNSLAVLDRAFARHHDFAEPGQILVSFRPLDAIAVISMPEERIVWMTRGFWSAQHDADPLADGRIMLFDNQGYGGPGGKSRVVEFAPGPHRVTWSYTGDETRPFLAEVLGAQQTLRNGNVLITSSVSGRIFEVDRSGDIVWHYINPERRRRGTTEYTSSILEATRVSPDAIDFVPELQTDP